MGEVGTVKGDVGKIGLNTGFFCCGFFGDCRCGLIVLLGLLVRRFSAGCQHEHGKEKRSDSIDFHCEFSF